MTGRRRRTPDLRAAMLRAYLRGPLRDTAYVALGALLGSLIAVGVATALGVLR